MYQRQIKLPAGKRSFFLFGPRLTGKSTLIESLLKDLPHITLNFLERDTFLKYKSSPERLRKEIEALDWGKKPFTIFIDEIQKVPELLDEIHLLIERYPGSLFFVMTGSSARKLKRASANLLAGRAWQFFLYPLTHQELAADFQLKRALTFGALPLIAQETDEVAVKTLSAYTQTYLKEEILDEALTRNVGAFSKFLEIAADQSGSIVNYSNIARETHVSTKTIQSYYQILEDTLLALRLPAFTKSARKRLVLHPKYYLFDLGVIHSLTGQISAPLREGTFAYGKAFEHFVILEILRLASYANKNWRFYHYRTSQGAEVDLIIETNKDLWALEIKSSTQVERGQLLGLKSFLEEHPRAKPLCISQTTRSYRAGPFTVIDWKNLFSSKFLDLSATTALSRSSHVCNGGRGF